MKPNASLVIILVAAASAFDGFRPRIGLQRLPIRGRHKTLVQLSSGAISADNGAYASDKGVPAPSLRTLLSFTLCAMPIYMSSTLLSLIDTAAVGQISSTQLAALGPSCAICDGLTRCGLWYACPVCFCAMSDADRESLMHSVYASS